MFGIKSVIALKKLDCELNYDQKFLKTKTRFCSNAATNFHARKIPEKCSNFVCWSVILIDSVLKKDENYYLQVFF